MIKNSKDASQWAVLDTSRSTYNVASKVLRPNLANAEADTADHQIDFLSNGFKILNAANDYNTSGSTYIGIAFAEHPFKYANAR